MTVQRHSCTLSILLFILPFLLFSSCSTSKNTWRERAVQSLNTRFNVYFNGQKSYDEGLQAILAAQKDDYNKPIPMYPISVHSNASAASSQMTRAIEKARKAIKTRSIKTKPKVNPSKRSDPKYRAFLQQEEYNPFMKHVWMLLAKAEFHKADFLGSVGTFNYIIRHFQEDKELQLACQLWVVRAYAEMGWVYEAEEMLRKLNPSDLQGDNTGLFAAVKSDLLLKQKQYAEALPFLEMALKWEKDKKMQLRFTYLLAQLHEILGNKKASFDAYSRIIDANPTYEMGLNARIGRSALFLQKTVDVRKELTKMIKNNNNKDYLDQLYYTIGLSYLHDKDSLQAIASFRKAAEESTRNGVEKATALIRMADVLYEQKNYVKAQPGYDEASKLITVEHEDYKRISGRAELLSELVVEYEMVQLQDSLQRLSAMSPEQQLETIKSYIAWLEREEALAAEREAERLARAEDDESAQGQMTGMPQMGQWNQSNDWYFYNPQTVRAGQQEFQRRWGKRKLEDNWRRANKSAALFGETADPDAEEAVSGGQEEAGLALTDEDAIADSVGSNTKNPEYYLRQIPSTPAQIEKSNELWADALYKMGTIYNDKLKEYQLAIETFNEYVRRFGTYSQAPEALFTTYLIHTKLTQPIEAEQVRQQLLRSYPQSRNADLLADPDFMAKRQLMFEQQDSLYALTYSAFNENEYGRVRELTDTVKRRFPTSTLMPRFLFLEALTLAKSGRQQEFEESLTRMLEAYPISEVSAMSKDMLALLRQGRESQQGGSHGSILSRRESELTATEGNDSIRMEFTTGREGPHRILFLSSASTEDLFPLQFQLAVYNFSKFLIKDFEITILTVDDALNSVSVYEFENYEEAEWYLQSIQEDKAVVSQLEALKVRAVVFSDFNYGLLQAGRSLQEYELFISTPPNPPQQEEVSE